MSLVEKIKRIFTSPRTISPGTTAAGVPWVFDLPKSAPPAYYPILQIPPLEAEILELPATTNIKASIVQVDLGKMTCTCAEWEKSKRNTAPVTSIGRCCPHMVKPVYLRVGLNNLVNPWTIAILESSHIHPPPARSEMSTFNNDIEDYLAFYDISRGYVQVFGPLRDCAQYGYEPRTNRWGWGHGPENPMVIKKQLRPWAKALDKKYSHEVKRK